MFNVNVLIGAQWENIVSPIRSRLPANGKAAIAYKTRPDLFVDPVIVTHCRSAKNEIADTRRELPPKVGFCFVIR